MSVTNFLKMKNTVKSAITKISIVVSLLLFLNPILLFAEGTPTLSPNATNITAVLVAPDLLSGSYLGAPEDNRIYFNISNKSTERLYFGFDWREYKVGSPARLTNLYYKIYNPSGVVVSSGLWDSTLGSAGSIDTHAKALIGPNIGGVSTGYTPLIFTPSTTGEHWIEFYRSNDNGVTATAVTSSDYESSRALAGLFDMTVATTSGVKRDGRVHSDKWGFVATAPNYGNIVAAVSEPKFYVYTDDKVILKIDFRPGFMPIAWNFAVNSYGVNASQSFEVARKSIYSVQAPNLTDGYKVFLNTPDASLYPVALVPSAPTFLSPLMTNCGPFNINYNISKKGDVRIVLDLNGIDGYQENTTDVILEAYDVEAGDNFISWNGKDGQGNLVIDGSTMKLTLEYKSGRFNMPIHDAEINKYGFNVQSIAPIAIANSQMFWDDSGLTNIGTSCLSTSEGNNNTTTGGLNNSMAGTESPTRAWSGDGNLLNAMPAPAVGTNEIDGLPCNDYGNVRVLNTWGWGLVTNSAQTITFKGCSDMGIVKTVNNNNPYVGANVEFKLKATNTGPSSNTNVIVTDALPTGYTFVSASATTGTYNNATGVWTIGNFAQGFTPELTITAKVNNTGVYTNTGVISGKNTDPNTLNNTSSVSTTPIPNADLSVVKTANTSSPTIGSNVTFNIEVKNNGPSAATGVTVNDVLPNGYTFVSATPSTGSWSAPNWTIGNLAIDGTATLTIVATVKSSGTYANKACVSGTRADLVSTNDCSTSTPNPVNAVIDAIDDSGVSINGTNGGTSLTNVLSNLNSTNKCNF